ncbi:MAG: hypothetical protein QHH07_03620 [Sedimentisphaerales bacterium]|jgi:hypothetical protein|nr:hypothetical protein [Sedimentisphaerales bacterium]
MDVQVAVLCDAATDENGKLSLLGAFDTLLLTQLPGVHPQCAIALRIKFGQEDKGQHRLRLSFVDADGRAVMPNLPTLPINVALADGADFTTRNFIINLQRIRFDRAGPYSIDLFWDEQQIASIPLVVHYLPPQRFRPTQDTGPEQA